MQNNIRFIRSGLFVARSVCSPPDITYSVQTDITTRYYSVLAESAGVVRYPPAIGRAMAAHAENFAGVALPTIDNVAFVAPVPQKIAKSVPTQPLSNNQQLAMQQLNITPYAAEGTSDAQYIADPQFNNLIIKLGTGQGKTRLIGHIINAIGRKAIVVVNQISLVKQTVAELSLLLPGTVIGFYYGAKQKQGDIIVATHKSLCIAKTAGFKFGKTIVSYRTFAAEIGTICYDEIHAYCTPKYWHLFEFGVDNMIGFSATPENSPHIMRAIMAVGPIIDIEALPGYDNTICRFTLAVTFMEYKARKYIAGEERNGRLDYHALMGHIRADSYRAEMIVGLCRSLIRTGAVIFVFSSVREYAIKLRRMFEKHSIDDPNVCAADYVPGESVLLIGDTAEAKQDVIMEAARTAAVVIFTTYGYADTGLNISRANTCILAEPRNANMIQRTGRIMRADGVGEFRNVYDIIDVRTPLKNQYKKRLPAYNARGAEFVLTRVSAKAGEYAR